MVEVLSDDARLSATKRAIARALDHGETEHGQLSEKVNADVGSGKVIFEAALNQMVGAHEVRKKRKEGSLRGRTYVLLEGGRKWL
jgi:hypothetical protein